MGREVDSGGATDPRKLPTVRRLEGQVIIQSSGFSLTQDATTLRRAKGGRFDDPTDKLSPENKSGMLKAGAVIITVLSWIESLYDKDSLFC